LWGDFVIRYRWCSSIDKGGAGMDDHEMWWRLRQLIYKQTLTLAEADVVRTWLHGFPEVLRVLQSKSWDPESQAVINAFETWYNQWWESGVFERPTGR
jgi:hypothetical protein